MGTYFESAGMSERERVGRHPEESRFPITPVVKENLRPRIEVGRGGSDRNEGRGVDESAYIRQPESYVVDLQRTPRASHAQRQM
jgi:hypothetical protein